MVLALNKQKPQQSVRSKIITMREFPELPQDNTHNVLVSTKIHKADKET